MGRRHQVFLIARLIPASSGKQTQARYRCIAGLHHQWCYGYLPISATRRFFNLLKNPDNAEIVRDEIRRAHGRYGRQGQDPEIPDMAFPYIQMLLTQAFYLDINDPDGAYAGNCHGYMAPIIDPNHGCFSHENDDGYTFIDITNPSYPAYCFEVEGVIVDADGYIRGDCREDDEKDQRFKDAQRHIDSLKDEKLVTVNVLSRVWPQYYRVDDDCEEPAMRDQSLTESLTTTALPTLADLALRQVVQHCVDDDNFEPLEALTDMPGKLELIGSHLFARKTLPGSAYAVVARVLQGELLKNGGMIDLTSSRVTMSTNAIRSMVSLVSSEVVKSINLSGQNVLTTEIIVNLLTSFPNLIRMTLLDTNITNDQIMDLLCTQPKLFYRVHDIIHPALLSFSPPPLPNILPDNHEDLHLHHQRLASGPHGFTIMQTGIIRTLSIKPAIASLPFFHPGKVLRGLTACLDALQTVTDYDLFQNYFVENRLLPSVALSVGTPIRSRLVEPSKDSEERLRWLHRSISTVPALGTYDDCQCHGWVFALDYHTPQSYGPSRQESSYAFIKVDGGAQSAALLEWMETAWNERAEGREISLPVPKLTLQKRGMLKEYRDRSTEIPETEGVTSAYPFKVYDVRGFADAVEKEGRPRPGEEVIAAFEAAIGLKEQPMPEGCPPSKPMVLMDMEEAKDFIPLVRQ